ncbi:MAG: hypothetical protein HY847_01310 [Betaproteobacteria bacterium]|nr:hypothetical protein [Betaproteobacteria bacterium]
MMEIRVVVRDARARAVMDRLPGLVEGQLEDALRRGAEEIARLGRDKAPKLFSALTNTLHTEQIEPGHYRVSTAVKYARAVEEGTGPAAGKASYYPDVVALQQYLTVSPKLRGFKWARKGSKPRAAQNNSISRRAKAWAWFIYLHGTKAQPYMRPAYEEGEPIVHMLARDAITRACAEAQA